MHTEYYNASWDSLDSERFERQHSSSSKRSMIFHEDVFELGLLSNPGEKELDSKHHMLGRYLGVQNEYCELHLANIKTKFPKLSFAEIDQALEWKLLLQFDSDDSLGFQWGDWGRVYFFIHQDDLRSGNFGQVKIFAQCY